MNSEAKHARLHQLQGRLGYTFADVSLLELALTHRSASKKNNERLEFLGDSLVNHVVAGHLFVAFEEAAEGQLSRLRAKLVRGTYLAQLASQFELGPCLSLGSGERKSGGRHRESILADALEAIAGAVLLDSDFETACQVISVWFVDSFQSLSLSDERDAKTRLQELLQGRGHPLPDYQMTSVEGADHEQIFTVLCRVEPLSEGVQGIGKSRRTAEQSAAEKVLEALA